MNEFLFPLPLTQEEQEIYMMKLKYGDLESRGILIEKNLRLVAHIAKKFENTGIDIEDLISVGSIGLIKAVDTFDIERNNKFSTYSGVCIEREILAYLKKYRKTRIEVSFEQPLPLIKEGKVIIVSDMLQDTNSIEDYVFNQERITMLYEILGTLSGRDRAIIVFRYGLDGLGDVMKQKEVARLVGVKEDYISKLEKKILKKLRRKFNSADRHLL
ncbi:MAG: sigma-70 family RNA polymerase sigma factor [Deltaproteobacteria bacterium]